MAIEGLQNLALSFGELFKSIIPDQQSAVVKKIAIQSFIGCVKKTPVDTGRARGNWSITLKRPLGTLTGEDDKAPFDTPPKSSREVSQSLIANAAKPVDTIYITNALPYILPLEQGHSKQGSHMVEMTVNEIKQHYGI